MKLDTIQQMWEHFESRVIPPQAHKVQREEMGKAFYAGAYSILAEMLKIADDSISEEEGEKYIEGWREEGEKFVADLLKSWSEEVN